jgi:cytochrome c556
MNKEMFKQNAKHSIDEIFDAIDRLQDRANIVEGEARIKLNETIVELKAKKQELQAKYDKLDLASDEKWEEVKTAFSSASDSFKEGFKKITSLIK